MKVLVISDVGTLSLLHDQTFKHKEIECVDKNALLYASDSPLAWVNIKDSPIQMCFGYFYSDLPKEDSRFAGKQDWFDYLVEIGSNKMSFLCSDKNYIRLDACHSITTVIKALKNVDTEER
jgi:hypothetical protein